MGKKDRKNNRGCGHGMGKFSSLYTKDPSKRQRSESKVVDEEDFIVLDETGEDEEEESKTPAREVVFSRVNEVNEYDPDEAPSI